MRLIEVVNKNGQRDMVNINNLPDQCPFCHRGIAPAFICGYNNNYTLQVVFRCTFDNCDEIFIGYYSFEITSAGTDYYLDSIQKGTFKQHDFNTTINELSPDFCKIYNQALKAEEFNLDQISGVGYRKALEFLIKDFIIKDDESKEPVVKNDTLGNCIKNYIENTKLKSMAERAAWIGNDETHYVRKWEDKDIVDLKNLISATVHWIEMEEITRQYTEGMKKK